MELELGQKLNKIYLARKELETNLFDYHAKITLKDTLKTSRFTCLDLFAIKTLNAFLRFNCIESSFYFFAFQNYFNYLNVCFRWLIHRNFFLTTMTL